MNQMTSIMQLAGFNVSIVTCCTSLSHLSLIGGGDSSEWKAAQVVLMYNPLSVFFPARNYENASQNKTQHSRIFCSASTTTDKTMG
jgi:hypothetical protein